MATFFFCMHVIMPQHTTIHCPLGLSIFFFFFSSFIFHNPYFLSTSSFTYYPNHLTNSTHIAVSPEQACTLVHHPSTPISPGLLCPNPGFRPHLGLSYPSWPLVPIQSGVITPSSCWTWTFVLSQQACEL